MTDQNIKDLALGCIIGVLVGDAAGATLEFLGKKPTEREAKDAFYMPGGGVLNLAPGQITDDSEMMISLALALIEKPNFSADCIGEHYKKWIASRPIDIGSTTIRTIGGFMYNGVSSEEWNAKCMVREAKMYEKSKANGCLMRIAPLGVWGHKLSEEQLAKCATLDSSLSHCNLVCCTSVSCYVIAISHLLKNPQDREGAFRKAENWAQKTSVEVYGWIQNAKQNIIEPYYPQAGFIKIAFSHAFRQLLYAKNYKDAIIETLAGGGDTDTNACIVGGLLGALFGISAIPEKIINSILQYKSSPKHPRPEFLHPKNIYKIVEDLIANAPENFFPST